LKSDSHRKFRKDKNRDKLYYSIGVMSFFGAEGKEPSFEREKKKREGERKREKRKINSGSQVLGLGYRKS
jgi:hypothetical protein